MPPPQRIHRHWSAEFLQGKTTRSAVVMLFLAAFLWGSGNLANKTILDDLDPVSAVLFRSTIAALALAWPAIYERVWAQGMEWLRSVAPGSVMFALALLTQQWGYQTATVTNASFLVNAACVLTPVLGILIWRDQVQLRTMLAAFLVLLGALLMSGAWWSMAAVNAGDVLCLISAVFYALWMILTGRHLTRFPTPTSTTLAQCVCAALVSAPFVWRGELQDPGDWLGAVPEALYLGLFSTAAAFALTAAAQTRVSASTAAVLISAESLFGAAAGILFLGERPSLSVHLGGALILTAIVVIALRPELRPAPLFAAESDQGKLLD
ncbi:MAG: DMT family transporter [Paracoccaceae bacterium]